MTKIAIDAGHGRFTAGKRVDKALDPNETREWVLNDRVVRKIMDRLDAYEGYDILRVDDETGRVDVPLRDRVVPANEWKAEIYVSVHHNAGAKLTDAGGVVVYRQTNSLARSKVYQDLFYDHLIEHTRLRGNRSNPKPTANLYVTRETRMPALLLELGFMDSRFDVPIILTEQFADQCADAIVAALVEIFELTRKPAPSNTNSRDLTGRKFWRVNAISVQKWDNAQTALKKLQEAGFKNAWIGFVDLEEE